MSVNFHGEINDSICRAVQPSDEGAVAESNIELPLCLMAGSGHLCPRSVVTLVCLASMSLKQTLDFDFLWKQIFLRWYRDRVFSEGMSATWPQRLMVRQSSQWSTVKITSDSQAIDWEASVVFVGPPRSGKTCLINRICTGEFPEKLDAAPFLGCGLRVVGVRHPDGSFGRIRLWEPSGGFRETVLDNYMRAADVIVIVVDVATDSEGPEEARAFLARVAGQARPRTVLAVCGSQVDHRRRRVPLSAAALEAVAKESGAEFGLCSAWTGEGVQDLFCQNLAAAREGRGTASQSMPLLSSDAGSLSPSELLNAFLHRR